MKTRTVQIFRTAAQVASLALFMFLVIQGRAQMWLLVFLAVGAGLSLLLGRVYCGWLCPMGTALRAESWIMKKLKIRRITPSVDALRRVWPRIMFLVGLTALMLVVKRSGREIPVLLYITIASVIVSLVFHEAFWHRQICPFGTILSLTSRVSPRAMKIDAAGCIGCGKCQPVCPSLAIVKTDEPTARGKGKLGAILRNECFLCGKCRTACPVEVIDWKR